MILESDDQTRLEQANNLKTSESTYYENKNRRDEIIDRQFYEVKNVLDNILILDSGAVQVTYMYKCGTGW